MTQRSQRRHVALAVESLEDRLTPAGAVIGSLANHVWKLTGDDLGNSIIVASAGSPGAFTVTSDTSSLSAITALGGVTTATGVQKIVFDMKGGNDKVEVDTAKLTTMVFQGGDGDNYFLAGNLVLSNKLNVSNGVGFDQTYLEKFKIAGNVNVNNGSGGSRTLFYATSAAAGFNKIGGSVHISNAAGVDDTTIADTNVGGNIVASSGAGDGTNAGSFTFANSYQTQRATVGSNVTVKFQDGAIRANNIFDAVIHGNVFFGNGSGDAKTYFDGFRTSAPVRIDGNLKITGTGTNLVSVGRQFNHTGLRVGHDLIIDTVSPTDLTLQAFKLIVDGKTRII